MHCLHSVIRFCFKTNKKMLYPSCKNNLPGHLLTNTAAPSLQPEDAFLPSLQPSQTWLSKPPSTHCSSLAGGQSPLQLAWLVSHGAQWLSELTPVTPPCHHTAALAQNAAITLHIFDGFTISLFAHTFHLDL